LTPRSAKKQTRDLTGEYLRPVNKYRQSKTPQEYLEQRIKAADNGCWLFTGLPDKNGYGQVYDVRVAKDTNVTRAHQLSYVAYKGTIPSGMLVCHSCDTPECVNPAHLWLGTPQDNMTDKVNKGRWRGYATKVK
jgi:hypothetical protein